MALLSVDVTVHQFGFVAIRRTISAAWRGEEPTSSYGGQQQPFGLSRERDERMNV